jgi:hypothetical protein
MKKKIKRPGSGRTKGSVSFSTVSLSSLNEVLRPDAKVLVSRRFAEGLGISNKPISATTTNIEALSTSIEVKEIELERVVVATTEW